MDVLAAAHPTIMSQKFSIGTTLEGRSIWVYKISNSPNEDNGQPEIFFNAYIHAREAITFEVAYDLATTLVNGYGSVPRLTNIVDTRQIYIQPVVNPDGVEYNAQTDPNGGGMWRKNRRNNGDGHGDRPEPQLQHSVGIRRPRLEPVRKRRDLSGTGPFSEPETQAVRDFVNAHHFKMDVNLHSYGRHQLFAWGYDTVHLPDYEVLLALGRLHRSTSGYNTGAAWENLYIVNGDANDWMYGDVTSQPKIYSFVSEIGTNSDGFWPLSSRIPALKAENRRSEPPLLRAGRPSRADPPARTRGGRRAGHGLDELHPCVDGPAARPRQSGDRVEPDPGDRSDVGADNLEGPNPNRWNADGWTLSTARSHSATHSFYGGNLDAQNNVLISRRGHLVQPGESLRFWTWYRLESDWDYGYVELSTDGRTFTPLPGTITTTDDPNHRNLGNGITGASNGWVQASFSLSSYVGQVAVVRAERSDYWRNGATVASNDIHNCLDQLVAVSLSRIVRPLQPTRCGRRRT